MKKSIFFVAVLSSAVIASSTVFFTYIASSCSSTKISETTSSTSASNPYDISKIKMPKVHVEGGILGIVQIFEDNVFITENPTSRSCVTYSLEGDETLLSEIKKNDGTFIIAKGTVTQEISPWSKTLAVESFEQVK